MRSGIETRVVRFTGMAEDAPPVGIVLGATYCAEHEQGIGTLERLLGIGKLADRGIEKRQMSGWMPTWGSCAALVIDDGLDLYFRLEADAGSVLERVLEARPELVPETSPEGIVRLAGFPPLDERKYRRDRMGRGTLRLEVEPHRHRAARTKADRAEVLRQTTGFYSVWNERGFAVTARGEEPRATLQAVIDAYAAGTLVVTMGSSGNPFERSGVSLLVLDRVPADVRQAVLQMDEDHLALMATVRATGIEARLKAAGLQYHALSPQLWAANRAEYGLHDLSDAERLQFFLNPRPDLRHYGQTTRPEADSGWYTVQDLDAWIAGQGAVVKGSPEHVAAKARHMGADVLGRLRRHLDPEGMAVLDAAAEATGVPELLRNGRLEVFALEPHWLEEPGGQVVFWVNPQAQDRRRLGWFTADELHEMAADQGPGMKSDETLAAMAQADPGERGQLQMEQRSWEEMAAAAMAPAAVLAPALAR